MCSSGTAPTCAPSQSAGCPDSAGACASESQRSSSNCIAAISPWGQCKPHCMASFQRYGVLFTSLQLTRDNNFSCLHPRVEHHVPHAHPSCLQQPHASKIFKQSSWNSSHAEHPVAARDVYAGCKCYPYTCTCSATNRLDNTTTCKSSGSSSTSRSSSILPPASSSTTEVRISYFGSAYLFLTNTK